MWATCLDVADEKRPAWPFTLNTFLNDRVVHFVIPFFANGTLGAPTGTTSTAITTIVLETWTWTV